MKKNKKKCLSCGEDIKPQNKYCDEKCSLAYRKKERDEKVLNGIASAMVCKKYLIEKYGNICLSPDCAQDFNKFPVNVELEHIDGNGENNNLANLTLLCPNCHSLTDTHRAKNIGKGRSKRMERYHSGKSY